MSAAAEELRGRATTHQEASDTAHARTRRVFNESWTDGAGATAYAHYRRENQAHETLYRSFDDAAAGMGRLAEDVGRAKRNMYSADAAAHREIEEVLRAAARRRRRHRQRLPNPD